jgi:N6-L-threonylcarbamoyladenine synthase
VSSSVEASEPALILAIETSCDETAVAIARGTGKILASEIASQVAIHRPYGGVVPEVASREHNRDLRPLIEHTLKTAGITVADIDAVAATAGPGLASSLLVGNTTAKAFAVALDRPYHAINHLEGHLLSPFIGDPEGVRECIALIVSGGHTNLIDLCSVGDYEVLGTTRDDAAGEAFDKVGKLLGLPYPGGPEIDKRSSEGDPAAYDFPRSMLDSGDFEFSFSGLKTSVAHQLQRIPEAERHACLADLCASFQQTVIDILLTKTLAAAEHTGHRLITLSGGVSCNRSLRTAFESACTERGIELKMAAANVSTDNAAMIAYAAAARIENAVPPTPLSHDISPNLRL